MGLTLQLTRNVLNTFVGWKAQVLHDLHESVPYLYDNTVGDGPYNAWIDPILADEWQMMGWNNVSEMTKFGMPGVFTHGTFDTWSPSYLMFIAAMHNGISRLYETFGNGGADTEERTLRPNEYARTWYKQNPPLPKAKWSQRNNNNYEQTGVLTALTLFRGEQQAVPAQLLSEGEALDREAAHRRSGGVRVHGRRSAARRAGRPAAMLQDQGCEIFRATAPFTVMMPAKKARARRPRRTRRRGATEPSAAAERSRPPPSPRKSPSREPRTFPAGQLRAAHGPTVQPHRRHAARLSILGGQRSAEEHLRRHRLDLRRTRQRAGGARHRCEGAGRRDDARGGRGAGARRRRGHGRDLPDQSQRR